MRKGFLSIDESVLEYESFPWKSELVLFSIRHVEYETKSMFTLTFHIASTEASNFFGASSITKLQEKQK